VRKPGLPASLKILGATFRVEVCDLEDPATEVLFGTCDVDKRVIRINKNVSAADARKTLFHESLHAALGIAGLDHSLPGPLEESVVVCLENAMWPLLRMKWEL
jgi:hypothetical protein